MTNINNDISIREILYNNITERGINDIIINYKSDLEITEKTAKNFDKVLKELTKRYKYDDTTYKNQFRVHKNLRIDREYFWCLDRIGLFCAIQEHKFKYGKYEVYDIRTQEHGWICNPLGCFYVKCNNLDEGIAKFNLRR